MSSNTTDILTPWKEHLQVCGARMDHDRVLGFEQNRNMESGTSGLETSMFALSHLGILDVAGEEADSFLDAMLTVRVSDWNEHDLRLAALCDIKGRVLFVGWMWRCDAGFSWLLPGAELEAARKTLQRYVLRAKVALIIRQDVVVMGLVGADASALIRHENLPFADRGMMRSDDVSVAALPRAGDKDRLLILGRPDTLISLWRHFQEQCRPSGYNGWELYAIQACEPCVSGGLKGELVAQMINLDWLGAVDFDKGCYIGQEVIARLHYRGRASRRMFRGKVSSDAIVLVEAGMKLWSDAQGGQMLGMVIRSARGIDGGWSLLASVRLEDREATLPMPAWIDGVRREAIVWEHDPCRLVVPESPQSS